MSIGKLKPGEHAVAVTPSDSTNIDFGGTSPNSRAVYIGSAGDLSVEMTGDDLESTVVYVGVLSGTILPISITRVNSTGTTAGSIVAIW